MLIDPTRAILPSFIIAAGLGFAFHTLTSRLRQKAGEGESGNFLLSRFAFSLSLAIACFVGVNLLRGIFSLPEKYWECLSVIALVMGFLSPTCSVAAFRWRLLAWPLIGLAFAWFLVPDWSTLEPSRQVYVPLLASYLAVLGLLYDWGGNQSAPRELLFALCVTTATLAAATAAIVSLKYGELTSIVFAGLAAIFSVSVFIRLENAELAGLLPVASTLIGGVAFVDYIYPQPPVYEFLLLPLAPVGLFVASHFSKAQSARGTAIRIGGFLAALLPIVITILLRYGVE